MVDTFSKEKRSWVMGRIRSKDTAPEKKVRSLLHQAGYRFRLHDAKLPGKPDIVLKQYKTTLFVNGCFWHQHPGCKRATSPNSNKEYWEPKLRRNVQRFKQVKRQLEREGWTVVVVWECETKDLLPLLAKLNGEIKRNNDL